MEAVLPHLNVVIICGQTGNELWPLVHSGTPRETVTFPMESESLLEETIRRSLPLTSNPITFVCRSEISAKIESAIRSSKLLDKQGYEIITEPVPRGSAFSIALAAASLKRKDPNAYMLVMPSHLAMETDDRWEQAVVRAYRVAAADMIAVMGTPPAKSSVPHSFIRPAREIKGIPGARYVTDFVFNPAVAQSSRYESLGFLWFSGIMAMRASTALSQLMYVARSSDLPQGEEMDRVAETAGFLVSVGESRWQSEEARELVGSLPEISFEEAVLAACHELGSVQVSLDCTQLTTLRGLDDMIDPDENSNRIVGRAFAINSTNTTVLDEDRLTVTLGCDDIMVVNTKDSVLVAAKDALDSLPEVLSTLIEAGVSEAESSSVSHYGWGVSTILYSAPASRVRLVEIYPGQKIKEYKREHVEEVWTVLCGKVVERTRGGRKTIGVGHQARFSRRERHGLENHTDETAVLLCIEIAKGGPGGLKTQQ